MIATRAEFARLMGVNRSSVTGWAKLGRLVLVGDQVDVEASQKRLAETGGARPDVAARHAAARAAQAAPPAAAAPSQDGDRIGNSYQAARAVKEKYNALQSKLEYERQVGDLIPRADVETALRALGAAVRAQLDLLPDQVAPLVAPVADLDDCHAILADAARAALHQLGQQVERVRADLTAGRAS